MEALREAATIAVKCVETCEELRYAISNCASETYVADKIETIDRQVDDFRAHIRRSAEQAEQIEDAYEREVTKALLAVLSEADNDTQNLSNKYLRDFAAIVSAATDSNAKPLSRESIKTGKGDRGTRLIHASMKRRSTIIEALAREKPEEGCLTRCVDAAYPMNKLESVRKKLAEFTWCANEYALNNERKAQPRVTAESKYGMVSKGYAALAETESWLNIVADCTTNYEYDDIIQTSRKLIELCNQILNTEVRALQQISDAQDGSPEKAEQLTEKIAEVEKIGRRFGSLMTAAMTAVQIEQQ